ncbi:MAG: hypothetical protein R6U88_03380 [Candidatus Bipolaricaulota bacterium]
MKATGDGLQLSAGDPAHHLGCKHQTYPDLCVTQGELESASYAVNSLEVLKARGMKVLYGLSWLNVATSPKLDQRFATPLAVRGAETGRRARGKGGR